MQMPAGPGLALPCRAIASSCPYARGSSAPSTSSAGSTLPRMEPVLVELVGKVDDPAIKQL
eukprot:12063428-Prorocentrum_lima.AAC.1